MNTNKLQELKVYVEATQLRKLIYDLASTFPKDEKYRLCDQMIRSSRKCPANIAEGYGRFHYQENIQFCRIARGSLTELLDHLLCALECHYIDKDKYLQITQDVTTILKMLNGYIKYIQELKARNTEAK